MNKQVNPKDCFKEQDDNVIGFRNDQKTINQYRVMSRLAR